MTSYQTIDLRSMLDAANSSAPMTPPSSKPAPSTPAARFEAIGCTPATAARLAGLVAAQAPVGVNVYALAAGWRPQAPAAVEALRIAVEAWNAGSATDSAAVGEQPWPAAGEAAPAPAGPSRWHVSAAGEPLEDALDALEREGVAAR